MDSLSRRLGIVVLPAVQSDGATAEATAKLIARRCVELREQLGEPW